MRCRDSRLDGLLKRFNVKRTFRCSSATTKWVAIGTLVQTLTSGILRTWLQLTLQLLYGYPTSDPKELQDYVGFLRRSILSLLMLLFGERHNKE